MDGGAIEATVTLTRADIRDFYRHGNRLPTWFWPALFGVGLLGVALYVVSPGVGFGAAVRERPVMFGMTAFGTLLAGIAAFRPDALMRGTQATLEKFAHTVYRFKTEELEVETVRGGYRHPWTDFEVAGETPSTFFLYLTPTLAFVVPKRDVPPGREAELRAFLQARVPKYRRRG